MLSYYKISSFYGKEKANFINSIFVNLIYLILITPGIYFFESPNLSKYWFFTLLIIFTRSSDVISPCLIELTSSTTGVLSDDIDFI